MTPQKKIEEIVGNGWKGVAVQVLYEKGIGTLFAIVLLAAFLWGGREFVEMHRQHLTCSEENMHDVSTAVKTLVPIAQDTQAFHEAAETSHEDIEETLNTILANAASQ